MEKQLAEAEVVKCGQLLSADSPTSFGVINKDVDKNVQAAFVNVVVRSFQVQQMAWRSAASFRLLLALSLTPLPHFTALNSSRLVEVSKSASDGVVEEKIENIPAARPTIDWPYTTEKRRMMCKLYT